MCKAYRQASKLLSSLGPLQCLQQLLGHAMLFQTSQPFPKPFPLPGMLSLPSKPHSDVSSAGKPS